MGEGEVISVLELPVDSPEDSSTNMADVRPVRQPWSRCVAHQSSRGSSEEVDVVEAGGVGGEDVVGK